MKWTPEAIRKLRFDLGDLSRKDFGDKAGVSIITVYRWEKGKTKPEADNLKRLDELKEVL